MPSNCPITRATLSAQERFFRLAERECDLSMKAIHLDTGIPYDTLRSYAARGAMMPLAVVNKLAAAGYPDALLSILTEPSSRDLVKRPDGGGLDLDALKREAASFVADALEAEADGNVTPFEQKRLHSRASRIAIVAGAAA